MLRCVQINNAFFRLFLNWEQPNWPSTLKHIKSLSIDIDNYSNDGILYGNENE